MALSPPLPSVSPEGCGVRPLSAVWQSLWGSLKNLVPCAYLQRRGLALLGVVRVCLARDRVAVGGVHAAAAGLWVRGAGLGVAAAATVHRVGLPAPRGGHGKSQGRSAQGGSLVPRGAVAEMPGLAPHQGSRFPYKRAPRPPGEITPRGLSLRGSVCLYQPSAPREHARIRSPAPGPSPLPAWPQTQDAPSATHRPLQEKFLSNESGESGRKQRAALERGCPLWKTLEGEPRGGWDRSQRTGAAGIGVAPLLYPAEGSPAGRCPQSGRASRGPTWMKCGTGHTAEPAAAGAGREAAAANGCGVSFWPDAN